MPSSQNDVRRQVSFSRRGFLQSLIYAPLMGCSDSEDVRIRYRVIVQITYNGHPLEASTVMECHYQRIKHSLIGNGGATRLHGEALIFNLPDNKSFFVLPWARDKTGGLRQFYEFAITMTLGMKNNVGSLTDEDLAYLKSVSGRFPVFDKGGLPAFVGFDDEADPNTIFEIAPYSNYPKFPGVRPIGEVFPGVRFEQMKIEITTDPVTNKLSERLPWLRGTFAKEVFDRDSVRDASGHQRSFKNRPIRYVIGTLHFFGLGG